MENHTPLQRLAESGLLAISETGFDLKRPWPSHEVWHCEFSEIRHAVWRSQGPCAISITTMQGQQFLINLLTLPQKAHQKIHQGLSRQTTQKLVRETRLELIRVFRRKIPAEVQKRWDSFWMMTWSCFDETISKEDRKRPDYKQYLRHRFSVMRKVMFLTLATCFIAIPLLCQIFVMINVDAPVARNPFLALVPPLMLALPIGYLCYKPEVLASLSSSSFVVSHLDLILKSYEARPKSAWQRVALGVYCLTLLCILCLFGITYLQSRHTYHPTHGFLECWVANHFMTIIRSLILTLLAIWPVYGIVRSFFPKEKITSWEQEIARLAEREFDVDLPNEAAE